jgi:hypothetical protein
MVPCEDCLGFVMAIFRHKPVLPIRLTAGMDENRIHTISETPGKI